MNSPVILSDTQPGARSVRPPRAGRPRAVRKTSPGASDEGAVKPDRILQLAWAYAPPLILEAALRHGIFNRLEPSPRTVEELALETRTSARGLRALLNALVGMELLLRQGDRYGLTPESATFLVSTKPTYYGAYFRAVVGRLIPDWLQLAEVVKRGRPVVSVDEGESGPEFFAGFVEALFPLSYPAAQRLGEHLKVPEAAMPVRVLDLGAGSGVWGIALAHQSRQVTIRAVDWPQVLEVTRRMAERHGVADRLETSAGDLLAADFGQGYQVAILGHILHSEGANRSRQLLRRTFAALAPGGTIAISEFTPKADRTGPLGALLFAVNMVLHTEAGDTFCFEEISEWLREAGFKKPRQLEAPAPSPLILATRPK